MTSERSFSVDIIYLCILYIYFLFLFFSFSFLVSSFLHYAKEIAKGRIGIEAANKMILKGSKSVFIALSNSRRLHLSLVTRRCGASSTKLIFADASWPARRSRNLRSCCMPLRKLMNRSLGQQRTIKRLNYGMPDFQNVQYKSDFLIIEKEQKYKYHIWYSHLRKTIHF